MTSHDRIEHSPKIMLGKPVIRGPRITVELMIRKLAAGADDKAIWAAYPCLTAADIQAALSVVADELAHPEFVLSSTT